MLREFHRLPGDHGATVIQAHIGQHTQVLLGKLPRGPADAVLHGHERRRG